MRQRVTNPTFHWRCTRKNQKLKFTLWPTCWLRLSLGIHIYINCSRVFYIRAKNHNTSIGAEFESAFPSPERTRVTRVQRKFKSYIQTKKIDPRAVETVFWECRLENYFTLGREIKPPSTLREYYVRATILKLCSIGVQYSRVCSSTEAWQLNLKKRRNKKKAENCIESCFTRKITLWKLTAPIDRKRSRQSFLEIIVELMYSRFLLVAADYDARGICAQLVIDAGKK